REGGLTRVTEDDSRTTILAQRGQLAPEKAERIEEAETVGELSYREWEWFDERTDTFLLSPWADTQPTIHYKSRPIKPGDLLVLTTPGVHHNLTRRDMQKSLERNISGNRALGLVLDAQHYG